jgi:glucosamine-6-phosphate deaminase
MTDRKSEVRELLRLSPEEVVARAGEHLVVCEDLDALHQRFAEDIASEIRSRNAQGEPTRLIIPVGPTGQHPIFTDIVRRESISLANCWFFFMDENCDDERRALPADHPLSFKGEAQRLLLDRLDPACGLQPDRVVFPDEGNIDKLAGMIETAGGIDTCYGGIGIHGHVAFNEPEPGVADSGPRLVRLNDFTVTINAVRARVGGNLECFPRAAYTLGMRQILGARRIRLCCRNGCEFDWANTVLRLALFGEPGDDYPVTHIRGKDYVITTDRDTLASPKNLI